MKQARVLALCSLVLFAVGIGAPVNGASELKLGTATGSNGDTVSVPLTLSSDQNVQGVVAAFDWDGSKLQGVNLVAGAALATANTVVRRTEPAYAVLGVVMDSDGVGGEIIPAGPNSAVASVSVKILAAASGSPVVVPLTFRDGTYATVDLGPALDNIIVVGGLSFGKTEGLALTPGSVTIVPVQPTMTVVSKSVTDPDACPSLIKVSVTMKTEVLVQGFQIALKHAGTGGAPALSLKSIEAGAAAVGADFIQAEIFSASGDIGGTLGVIMDYVDPFGTPASIGAGTKEIALYDYCVSAQAGAKAGKALVCHDASAPATSYVYNLTLSDGTLGDPVKDNLLVVNGDGLSPLLQNGTLTLTNAVCPPPTGIQSGFAAGGCSLCDVLDEAGNPLPDPNDPLDPNKHLQRPCPISAHAGETIDVGFFYKFPPSLVVDESIRPELVHRIQGLSMAVCYDSGFLHCKDGQFSLDGTITETVGAEFVNVHCEDSDPADPSRPGELIIGILVDALPPFDGQALPSTDDWLKVICVKFVVKAPASCVEGGSCTDITFCNGANGAGTVPTRNLISVGNFAFKPDVLVPGTVCVEAKPVFIRGDCNFTFSDPLPTITPERLANAANIFWPDVVDISDAAAVISFLFETGDFRFIPPCMDACDANDDGRVDLADSVYILRYLFKLPNTKPPVPFDQPGTDDQPGAKTPNDRLDCKAGEVCGPAAIP
jgi:hypothetical protein